MTTTATAITTTTMRGIEGRPSSVRLALLFLLSSSVAAVACGGDNLLLPADGDPAKIAVNAGDEQSAGVGQPLDLPLSAKVTDPGGRPVQGAQVVFLPPAGGVVVPGDTVRTNEQGLAEVTYTLSTTAGEQIVEARAPAIASATDASVGFHIMAMPEAAVSLAKVQGDSQSAQVLLPLADSLVVRAVDRFGNGVAGIEVTWEAKNGGAVSPETDTTGADGRAAILRTLGVDPGSYVTNARASDLAGSPVVFTSTAIAPPRPELVLTTQPSASASAGAPFDQQPVLQLRDAVGAPLLQADVNVTVQIADGGGSLGGKTNAKSDGNGMVRFTDLSVRGETGSRTLIFAAEGFTPTTSSAIQIGPGAPDAAHSSASVDNGVAGAATTITIRLQDEFGNQVPDSPGALSVSVEGANASGPLSISKEGNGVYTAAYTPAHLGTDLIHVSVGGREITGSPFQNEIRAGPTAASGTTAVITTTLVIFYYRFDILVTAKDSQGNPTGAGGDRVEISVDGGPPQAAFDSGNGTYATSFQSFSAVHSVAITLNGEAIQGSPYATP